MDASIHVKELMWEPVHVFTHLRKLDSTKNEHYHELMYACAAHAAVSGCYAFESHGCILYVGTVIEDYTHTGFRTNLEGRVHNIMTNHRKNPKTGRVNENLWLFNHLNQEIEQTNVELLVLSFDSMVLVGEVIAFREFTRDTGLVRAVERMLIAHYQRLGQCSWNRV